MARIRSIHPGLFTDDAFMAASAHARLLIVGVWCEAWDDGVFEWKPLTLKARVFPVDTVNVEELLAELQGLGFLKSFDAKGKKWGAVRNFRRFQRPKKPNSSGVLPDELRNYVGMPPPGSEEVPDQFPTNGEKSPQMEDGGGRREREDGDRSSVSKPDKSLSTSDPFRVFSEAEIDRLQIEYENEDVRTVLPELWEWARRKDASSLSERKRLVWGAFKNRRGATQLIEAKANAPPIQISSALSSSRLVRGH